MKNREKIKKSFKENIFNIGAGIVTISMIATFVLGFRSVELKSNYSPFSEEKKTKYETVADNLDAAGFGIFEQAVFYDDDLSDKKLYNSRNEIIENYLAAAKVNSYGPGPSEVTQAIDEIQEYYDSTKKDINNKELYVLKSEKLEERIKEVEDYLNNEASHLNDEINKERNKRTGTYTGTAVSAGLLMLGSGMLVGSQYKKKRRKEEKKTETYTAEKTE
jgi:hypothetical protein